MAKNCPGHRPWVPNRDVASAASLAGVAGRRRWPASLASRRRSRTKRTESSTKPTKTFHSPVHRKQRTAHREPRRNARGDIQRVASSSRWRLHTAREPRRDRRRDWDTKSEAQLDEGVVPTGTCKQSQQQTNRCEELLRARFPIPRP